MPQWSISSILSGSSTAISGSALVAPQRGREHQGGLVQL
jgi:hypothetical protein